MVPLSIYWSSSFLDHVVGPGHPESPHRLRVIKKKLEETGQWERARIVEARAATNEELALIHPFGYIQRVQEAVKNGPTTVDSADTEVSTGSMIAARKVAGAGLQAVDDILANRTRTAFIPGRPPGHHAMPSQAMGFCLFANISLAAAYALQDDKVDRIAIIDWDVHHGNGTQAVFYENDRAAYISLHEYPLYPGTGRADEDGMGAGRGFTLNFPLPASRSDDDYIAIFQGRLADMLYKIKPDILLISAGFDAHEKDPLAHMRVTSEGFAKISGIARQLADDLSGGRIISFLEGGYHPGALAEAVSEHLQALSAEQVG